jgi:XTP/dITP diphosphohydrolase
VIPKHWVLASSNPGKLREFQALLEPYGIVLTPQGDLKIPEAEEPYLTFLENALTKARQASVLSGLPAIADDSGLCVDALQGAPGVHSARYAGEPKSDARNNDKLLAELVDCDERRASFVCTLVLVRHPRDPDPLVAQGHWWGSIARAPKGAAGFGYDPLFIPEGMTETSAEITPEHKNLLSHRAQAIQRLIDVCRLG